MQHQLTIHSDLAELGRVFDWLDRAIAPDNPLNQDFKVICDELLSNIIHYGLDDNDHCDIDLTLTQSAGQIALSISDRARPFNPLSQQPPDLDTSHAERDPGGLGVALTCALTDDQHYRYEHGRNCFTVIKKIGADASSD